MKQGKKRIFSLLLCTVMAFTLFSATAARAADLVPYLDYENGGYVTRYAAGASLVAPGPDVLWDSGWYLVKGNVSIGARFINGDVRLILADGASLTVGESGGDYAGLTVPKYGTLSIYPQSSGSDMGKLIATGVGNAAGIGSSGASGSCGTINIYGGDITATGSGIGAGIGASVHGSCDAINIYGGKITATGGGSGAGIGNVMGQAETHFGTINIYDGFVTATNGVGNLYPDIGGSGDAADRIHFFGGTVVSGRTQPQINLGNYSYRSSDPTVIIDGGSLQIGVQYSVGEMKPVVNGAGDAVSTFPAQLTIPGKHNVRVASILIGGTPFGNGAYTDGTGTLSLYLVESDHVRPVVVTMEDESSFWGVLQPGGFNLVTLADAETQRINPESTGFAKFMPMDVAVYLLDASSFTGISLEGSPLNAGTDYTVVGGTVTIKASYLQTLPGGTAALTFHFGDTSTSTLTVTIYDPPNYVALGDSIAAGYGLEDYDPMAPTPPQDAYASLVAQGMPSSVLGCLARSGMDSGVFLHLLDSPGLEAYLQNANVLTLSIGSDDILQPFLQTVADTLDCRIDRIQQALAEVMLDSSAYQSFLTDLSSALSTDSSMAKGLARFEENFPQIIAKLKSSAPSARIYVTNIYNPYLGVSLPPLDLGAFTDTYVSALNALLLSAPSPDYTLIDVYGAFAAASANPVTYPVNVNLATMNFDPHPNAAGHQIIANLILTAISSNAGHTVTFNLNGGTHTGGGALRQTVANGGAATAPMVTRGGYTFVGWDRAFTNVTADLTVTANWIADGGTGPSPAAPAAPSVVPPIQQPGQPVTAVVPIAATPGTSGSAMLNVPSPAISGAIASAQAAAAQGGAANGIAVEVNVAMPPSTSSLTAGIPQAALQSLVGAGVTSFGISGGPVTLSFNQRAIQALQSQASGGILLSIAPVSAPMPPVIGTHPAFEINIGTDANGAQNITNLGSGSVLIEIPYQPAQNETPNGLFGVYVDGNGNPSRIPGSAYDANAGAVLLSTSHNSVYGIGYEAPSARFTDIGTHWAKESIDYVVGRGLFSGTSATGFSPDTAMTRGMLVTALGRLAGVDARAYAGNSFTDVKADSPFRPYIEWAYGKGIVQGVGNGQFAPDKAVTRQEIAVIAVNYAKATGYKLPATRAASDFADVASVGSAYKDAVTAMQQAGIMMGGTNNTFNPKGNATRAEVSAMLDRYIRLTITPATAEGWALGDSGWYMYYKDGKPLTAWQTIDGEKYFFRTDGSLQTGWVKNGDNWRYYDRNKAAEGWLDIGGMRYYFDAYGSMTAGKWLQIDGKWYYFNADGALARNSKIDGYEVDENGVRKNK